MKASGVALCLAAFAFAFAEGRPSPPCVFGYCMGAKMYADADDVNSDGLLVVYRERSGDDEDGVYVMWAPKAGVCAVSAVYGMAQNGGEARRLMMLLAEEYQEKVALGEPTLQTDFLVMWMQPSYGVQAFSVHVDGVAVRGRARTHNVHVSFLFANHDACKEEMAL